MAAPEPAGRATPIERATEASARSLGTDLLVAVPTGATLVFVYAVHTLHAWRAAPRESVAEAAERGVRHAAHGVWTNALMVASGFFVLTLGRSRPLQNVGALVAAAMLLAALTTFVFLPLLARQRAYRRASPYET